MFACVAWVGGLYDSVAVVWMFVFGVFLLCVGVVGTCLCGVGSLRVVGFSWFCVV